MKKIVISIVLLLASACGKRPMPLHDVVVRRAYLAERDTVVTTTGTLINFGPAVSFQSRSLQKIVSGTDTPNIIISDTVTLGRPVTVRIRIRNTAAFGLDFGPILIATDDSPFGAGNRAPHSVSR